VANQNAGEARSNWELQDAKARFSELVKRAREQGRSWNKNFARRVLLCISPFVRDR